ncbi:MULTISPECIES: hypothetical protein [Methylobacillus]|uniref:Lipoprotein n=1 Tax=Methylobacillus flagellatus (strain ATCC 51484 / DSM 6875 / VKM B-1610 / KT) TaxID=265072 RepID=Q1GXV6_METFK|nr:MULTISPECIES: hypothetical protein [Methylobacillus]ABE50931.1 hypothetical protein Mfla_2668 [Methylobacillus flagellatus KT]MPS47478.1 hypothetical protein [Methylobacillus sp.]
MKLLSTSILAIFLASLALSGCSNKEEENVEAAAAEAVEQAQDHAEHAADVAEEAVEDAKDAAEDAIEKAREAAAEHQE